MRLNRAPRVQEWDPLSYQISGTAEITPTQAGNPNSRMNASDENHVHELTDAQKMPVNNPQVIRPLSHLLNDCIAAFGGGRAVHQVAELVLRRGREPP